MVKIDAFHLRFYISTMARTISVDVVSFFSGSRMDRKNRVVLSKFSQVKGELMRPKALFFSYCKKAHLIQLTWSGPLRSWQKFKVLLGVVVDQNS